MTRVSVIIPTYNRLRDLSAVLSALEAQTRRDFEIIVVDNGSTDGTEKALTRRMQAQEPLPFRYIRIEPSGPAGARNVGIEAAQGSYLAFVDSDVELAPDWLDICVAELDRDPGISAVGGIVVYGNDRGHVNAYGGILSRIGLAWDACEGVPVDRIREPAGRLWINCSALLARASAVRAAGAFDRRFFYGFEDSDLGWRMSAIAGPQRVLPNAHAFHNVGDTIGPASDQLVFHSTKNRLASLLANAGPAMLALYLPLYLGYATSDIVLRAPRWPKLQGLLWNLTNLGGTLRRRRDLVAARRLDDAALATLYAETLFPRVRLDGKRRRPNRSQIIDESAEDDRIRN